jgi:uncharacterized protein YwqG
MPLTRQKGANIMVKLLMLCGIIAAVLLVRSMLFPRLPKPGLPKPGLPKPGLPKPTQAAPQLGLPKPKRAPTAADIAQATAPLVAPGLRGTITAQAAAATDSRIGGPLIWPKGQTPPQDKSGTPLILLAQVDLATLPHALDLPRAGLLQMLIAPFDSWGCEFPSTNGNGFVVILHPPGTKFAAPIAPPSGAGPFRRRGPSGKTYAAGGAGISWVLVNCPPAPADYRLARLATAGPRHNPAEEEEIDILYSDLSLQRGTYDIMLRGNPDFTQNDVREDARFAGMVNLLAFSSAGAAFMWGDAGEACVLVPPTALTGAKDNTLAQAIYYWDCC